jgi:hypothetical protein
MKLSVQDYLKIIGFVSFVTLCVIGYNKVESIIKDKQVLYAELVGQKQKYEQLSAYSAKLAIDYKTQTDLKQQAAVQYANELGALKGTIKILSDATYLIKEKARDSKNSDVVFSGQGIKFVLNEIRFNDGPPIGYVLIFEDGRVVSKMYNHEFIVHEAISRENSGRYDIVSKADYVLKSPSINTNGEKNWLNIPYPLEITDGKATIDPVEQYSTLKKFNWFNPKLDAQINFDGDSFNPGFGVSLLGYGLTSNDQDYKFANIALNIDSKTKNIIPVFIPVQYRPFNKLISNTYIGPGVFYNGAIGYTFGVQVGL